MVGEIFAWFASPKTITLFERSFAWGQSAVFGLVTAAVVFVVTLYLLLDGKSLYAWLLAFVPRAYREKVATTVDEVSDVVHAYVSGQLLVAVLFALFTAGLLTILGVPAAVPLAVIAGLCDVIPVVGILIAIAARRLAGARGLAGTAAVVAIAYLMLSPGWRRTSCCRASGAASSRCRRCRCCSRCWLAASCKGSSARCWCCRSSPPTRSSNGTGWADSCALACLTDHKALAKAAESGSDVAIDTVISGEKHASEGFAGPASTGVSTR